MKFKVIVHPGASRERLIEDSADTFKVYLTKKAHRGKANKALVELLSAQFDVARSRIKIVQGAKSRFKVIEVKDG